MIFYLQNNYIERNVESVCILTRIIERKKLEIKTKAVRKFFFTFTVFTNSGGSRIAAPSLDGLTMN